jgi:hypothetical protein
MFAPFARDHPNPLVRAAVEMIAPSGDGKLRIAILGAAKAGEIDVLVKSTDGNLAHLVAPQVWQEPDAQVANPATMVATGKLAVIRELLPHFALEVQLAGADLYLRASQFKKLIGAGFGSSAARLRFAQEILDKFLEEHPGERLTISEHLERMRKHFPGASGASLVRAIREVRPEEWKDGGRPRGRRS